MLSLSSRSPVFAILVLGTTEDTVEATRVNVVVGPLGQAWSKRSSGYTSDRSASPRQRLATCKETGRALGLGLQTGRQSSQRLKALEEGCCCLSQGSCLERFGARALKVWAQQLPSCRLVVLLQQISLNSHVVVPPNSGCGASTATCPSGPFTQQHAGDYCSRQTGVTQWRELSNHP